LQHSAFIPRKARKIKKCKNRKEIDPARFLSCFPVFCLSAFPEGMAMPGQRFKSNCQTGALAPSGSNGVKARECGCFPNPFHKRDGNNFAELHTSD
jgi:hypothetical protein